MNHRSWVVASLASMLVLSVAPSARADGFFATFSTGQRGGAGVPRIAGAVFDATGTIPIDPGSGAVLGPLAVKPVHVEIDDVRSLAPLLASESQFENIPLVTIEFTAPDATGQEEVYMVGKYTNCNIVGWLFAFDPHATAPAPTTRNAVDFVYQSVVFSAPVAPKRPPTRPVAKEAPLLRRPTIVRREVAPTTPPPHIDDAYLQMSTVPGESTDHPGQIKLTAFTLTLTMPRDTQSGVPTGHLKTTPVTMSKPAGTASIALQNLFTAHTTVPSATVTFNQHRPGTTDLTLETLALSNVAVTSYTLQVGGATSGASLGLVYQNATFTDNRTSTAATFPH